MIKAVLFDLDGTLLPMDQDEFCRAYFPDLAATLAPFGYHPKAVIGAILQGTDAMIANDGTHTNEEVFWQAMEAVLGSEVKQAIPALAAYYETEFDRMQSQCPHNPMARTIVDFCHSRNLITVLATNPFFPPFATEKRMRWTGLTPADFALFTHYENSRYCKPNPAYFLDVAKQIGVDPADCLMVGNDASDDMAALKAGMQVFLMPRWLVNQKSLDLSPYPAGDFQDLMTYIDKHLQ